jgi:hypothetical protein
MWIGKRIGWRRGPWVFRERINSTNCGHADVSSSSGRSSGFDHRGERDRERSRGGRDFEHVRNDERGSGDGKHGGVYVSGCGLIDSTATSCQDVTHSFTPTVGDALSVQVVTTGTVVIVPAVKIIAEYGVTGGGGGGTPGGSAGQWQVNNAGSFGGLAGTSIIPQSGWTLQNAPVLNNFSTAQFGIFVLDNSSLNWRFITRPLPSGSTYTIAWTISCLPTNPAQNTQTCDTGLSDGTKYENAQSFWQGSNPSKLRIEQITNVNTDGSTVFGPTSGLTTGISSFCVVEDGTHRTWSHYSNGAWVQDLQEATGTFLTPTLLDVGGISVTGGASNYLQVQFLYLYAATTTGCP